jgi:hypothetical protein
MPLRLLQILGPNNERMVAAAAEDGRIWDPRTPDKMHAKAHSAHANLAHSELRPASLGPELWVGELPSDIRGTARITRNLEHHHFKYPLFRRPDDLHVHFFGTATLSFTDGVKVQDGDVFEIEAPPFSLPLRNPLQTVRAPATGARSL